MHEWNHYVSEQRRADLEEIIVSENLRADDTRKFMENAFRDGEIKTSGTDIDRLMPPISRFGGGDRAKKKQGIIDKLKAFFEKYFGLGGGTLSFAEPVEPTESSGNGSGASGSPTIYDFKALSTSNHYNAVSSDPLQSEKAAEPNKDFSIDGDTMS